MSPPRQGFRARSEFQGRCCFALKPYEISKFHVSKKMRRRHHEITHMPLHLSRYKSSAIEEENKLLYDLITKKNLLIIYKYQFFKKLIHHKINILFDNY